MKYERPKLTVLGSVSELTKITIKNLSQISDGSYLGDPNHPLHS